MRGNGENIRSIVEELAYNDSHVAYRQLYELYFGRIIRYIYMYTHNIDVSRELVSDIFMAVWHNRKHLPKVEYFTSYIYKMAKYKSLNHIRDRRPEAVDIDELPLDIFFQTRTTPEDECITSETIALINEAVESLPPKCKIAFKLIREDDMSYKAAAEHLNVSVKTLEIHMTTAIKKIRSALQSKKII